MKALPLRRLLGALLLSALLAGSVAAAGCGGNSKPRPTTHHKKRGHVEHHPY